MTNQIPGAILGNLQKQTKQTYIFFCSGAVGTIVGVTHAGGPADHAAALERSVIALVTDPDQRYWADVSMINRGRFTLG